MSINTQSYFHYGIEFTRECNKIDIQLSTFEFITLTFAPGSYCPTDLVLEMKLQFEGLGYENFLASFDPESCRIKIETTDTTPFRIGFTSGPNRECKAWEILGIVEDPTALYLPELVATNMIGKKYNPQFYLQGYLGPETNSQLVDATVNTSSSGKCEVLFCRQDRFIQFEIKWISDCPSKCTSYISDPEGVKKATDFLNWAMCRKCIIFVPDCTKPDEYCEIKLDRLGRDRKGTALQLTEMFRNIGCEKKYYETGRIRWRVVNKESTKDNT